MLSSEGQSLSDIEGAAFSWPWDGGPAGDHGGDATLWGHEGSGSGGLADHVFRHAARELFGQEVAELRYKHLR